MRLIKQILRSGNGEQYTNPNCDGDKNTEEYGRTSHIFGVFCQRMLFLDGEIDCGFYRRIEQFNNKDTQETRHHQEFFKY